MVHIYYDIAGFPTSLPNGDLSIEINRKIVRDQYLESLAGFSGGKRKCAGTNRIVIGLFRGLVDCGVVDSGGQSCSAGARYRDGGKARAFADSVAGGAELNTAWLAIQSGNGG